MREGRWPAVAGVAVRGRAARALGGAGASVCHHVVAVDGHVPVGQQQRCHVGGIDADDRTRTRTARRSTRWPYAAAASDRRRGRPTLEDAISTYTYSVEHDAARLLGAASRRRAPATAWPTSTRTSPSRATRHPGPLERLPRHRHLRPEEPAPDLQHRGLPAHLGPGRRGRARQHPRAHVGHASTTGANAGATCMGEPVTDPGLSGFEGIHIWDISNPAAPVYVRKLRMANGGNGDGAPAVGCGAHTATAVPDDARGNFYLYVGGSSGTCTGIDIVRITLADPTDARFLRSRLANGRAGILPRQQRADARRRPEHRLRDVRGRQRPPCTSWTRAKPGRRGRHARGTGRRREPDAGQLGVDRRHRRSRPLRLVHLRRQAT